MPKRVAALSDTVIFLFAGEPAQPVGTAFIVGYPVPRLDNATVPLVVTAKHVAADHKKLFGRFSTTEGKTTAVLEYDITRLKADGDYWEHPDEGVDIVVFRSMHPHEAKYEAIPLRFVATRETFQQEDIGQADRIVFPALLVNFLGSARNYPVLRDGAIALVPDEKVPLRFNVGSRVISSEQELILLDATSIPGASGSPVFLWPGPRIKHQTFTLGGALPYLLGVMHGFYPAAPRELVDIQTAGVSRMFAENSGIAIVFPSWRLREILERPDLKARIDNLAANEPPEAS